MRYFVFILILAQAQCPKSMDEPPAEKWANVYQKLDGTWEGVFYIYQVDSELRPTDIPKALDEAYILHLNGQITDSVLVRQVYTSRDPYYQEVSITDRYRNAQGAWQEVKSTGVNKVSGEDLWCIVDKPDEQVIHSGSVPKPGVIIWQRDLKNPTKKEYFYETVLDSTYSIYGYGYYGDADTDRFPKTWFAAKYRRQ